MKPDTSFTRAMSTTSRVIKPAVAVALPKSGPMPEITIAKSAAAAIQPIA